MTLPASTVELARNCCRLLAPPPKWTVSEWADAERFLSRESSSEPGKWSTDRAPYQRGIMDAINDPDVEIVVVMKSSQVGWTEILNNVVGYFVSHDPAPILLLQPTLDMAEAYSKDRLAPMFRDTPALANKVADARSRDSGNTLLHKQFPGGHITMAGSNAPASLASRPIRIVLCDEVDRYPASAGTEGDPIALATKRTVTFWNRKILLGSSPGIKGISRIEAAFDETDKRRYHLPCPACGHKQPLAWKQIDFATEKHACSHCGALSSQSKWQSQVGEWIATEKRPKNPKARGFHLCELYSPWRKWGEIIAEFKAAKAGGTERLKTWVNTSLGETWEEEGETVDGVGLAGRRESYGATLPAPVLVLTAGVDVQRDRLEVEVVGWGQGEESWSVEVAVFWGDPDKPDVWEGVTELMGKTYQHHNGHLVRISAMGIDSGGSNTQAVYDYCKGKQSMRVFCMKGKGGSGVPIISAPSRKSSATGRRKVDLFSIGVDEAKSVIYGRLQIAEPGPGYCHFSHAVNDEEFFAQLTAEKLVTTFLRGYKKRAWTLVRGNNRNEALDRRVYALAALKLYAPPWRRLARRMGEVIAPPPKPEESPQPAPADANEPAVEPAAQAPADDSSAAESPERVGEDRQKPSGNAPLHKRSRRSRGGWVQGWR